MVTVDSAQRRENEAVGGFRRQHCDRVEGQREMKANWESITADSKTVKSYWAHIVCCITDGNLRLATKAADNVSS